MSIYDIDVLIRQKLVQRSDIDFDRVNVALVSVFCKRVEARLRVNMKRCCPGMFSNRVVEEFAIIKPSFDRLSFRRFGLYGEYGDHWIIAMNCGKHGSQMRPNVQENRVSQWQLGYQGVSQDCVGNHRGFFRVAK